MYATATPVTKETKLSAGAIVEKKHGLNWLGFTMFVLLMIYPFIVQYLPLGIRQYLSAPLK